MDAPRPGYVRRVAPVQQPPRPIATLAGLAALWIAAGPACQSDGFDRNDLGETHRYAFLDAALERGEDAPPGELRVRLAFGGGADLDLYVTDTLQETVYFARRETRSGGFLEVDVRCDAEPPRIETARFPDAAPGVYRVGVDYSGACAEAAQPQGFVLEASYGDRRWLKRAHAEPMRFELVVWELEIPD